MFVSVRADGRLASRAPAKINLALHVLGRRPDGYHELDSLVAFAGAADLLEVQEGRVERGEPVRVGHGAIQPREAPFHKPSTYCIVSINAK